MTDKTAGSNYFHLAKELRSAADELREKGRKALRDSIDYSTFLGEFSWAVAVLVGIPDRWTLVGTPVSKRAKLFVAEYVELRELASLVQGLCRAGGRSIQAQLSTGELLSLIKNNVVEIPNLEKLLPAIEQGFTSQLPLQALKDAIVAKTDGLS